jgi:hypothetical protein
MKSVCLFLVCLTLAGFKVFAQTESWDTYMARYGSRPGSVLVDMGLKQTAPDKLLPYLVITGPKTRNCNSVHGIPDSIDINAMEHILDLTGGILSGVTAKKLTGTFTYNCERLNYYYVRDTTAVRGALTRMYHTHFPNQEHTIKIKSDPQWTTYKTFLYPDSTATVWMHHNKILVGMLNGGDNLVQPRNINHTLYFVSDTGRLSFINYAKAHRYSVTGMKKANSDALPYELTISRFGMVDMDSIMSMESELKTAAPPLKGFYNGWDAYLK